MTNLRVNGVTRAVDADPAMPLLWALRDLLGLTGTKYGCGIGACGACTVHLNGQAVRSCITSIGDVGDQEVTTIEGLSPDGTHPVQRAWIANNVPQCGYCQVGQIMQAAALLKDTPKPTDQQITMRCLATSAAAAPTSASGQRSSKQRSRAHDHGRKPQPTEHPPRHRYRFRAGPRLSCRVSQLSGRGRAGSGIRAERLCQHR